MDAITQALNAIEQGDPHAAEQLLPLVYDELHRLAAQSLALVQDNLLPPPTVLPTDGDCPG
jgi:hypothetical protein